MLLAAVVIGLGVALAVMVLVGRWAGERALQGAMAQAHNEEMLSVALLRNHLDKFRALPFVLADDVDIHAVLGGASPGQLEALDEKLERLSRGVGASVIYLLDVRGVTIAASNWRDPLSFVGNDYRFRPYFRDAVKVGHAEHFALGATSHQAGLYLSRRIADASGTLMGVVVFKVDFRDLEADWRGSAAPVFVTDGNGVVLLGNVPDWRFRVIRPLPEALAQQARTSLQFGDAAFDPVPLRPALVADAPDQVVTLAEAVPGVPVGTRLLHSALPVGGSLGWQFHMLTPVGEAVDRAVAGARLAALLVLALVYAAGGFVQYRRYRVRMRAHEQARARAELEAQVDLRTAQLNRANQQLRTEMDERQRAEARVMAMHDELTQAARLAVLGQVAAGVAHEINQPVAAIRTYADNAAELLRRSDTASAGANLATIARLTDRIGRITGELRAFSRKDSPQPGPILLQDALEGALLLVGARLRRQGVNLIGPDGAGHLHVVADRIRLEQVFVNLLQNAMDALEGVADATIRIAVHDEGGRVRVSVRDNGPGILAAVLGQIFMPFQTTKADGLGLGLVISRDILASLGGELTAGNVTSSSPDDPGGAIFTVTLNKAERGSA